MREIKFRAWHPENKVMVIFDGSSLKDRFIAQHFALLMCGEHPDSASPLMQYTGLNDKNGNPIFEGDIVKSELTDQKEYDLGNYVYGVIEFHDSGCFYEKLTHKHGTTRVYWEKIDSDDSIVVGNIHENKELLNG